MPDGMRRYGGNYVLHSPKRPARPGTIGSAIWKAIKRGAISASRDDATGHWLIFPQIEREASRSGYRITALARRYDAAELLAACRHPQRCRDAGATSLTEVKIREICKNR